MELGKDKEQYDSQTAGSITADFEVTSKLKQNIPNIEENEKKSEFRSQTISLSFLQRLCSCFSILLFDIITFKNSKQMLQRIKQELNTQYHRYASTKYGKLASICIYLIIFLSSQYLTNYTTSQLMNKTSQQNIYIFSISMAIIITQFLWCAFMAFVYRMKLPFFQQYRVDPKQPWPWEQNPDQWSRLLRKSINITSFVIFIFVPTSLWIDSQVSFNIEVSPQKTPTLGELIPQIVLMMFIEDFLFFTIHYNMHQPLLYPIHKVHHQYTTSVSIAGLHFHMVEFFFTQSVSSLINIRIVLLFGPLHLTTLVSWFVLRIWAANNEHSGYNFSWTPIQLLPFCANDQFHDFHHSNNSGNYSSHFRIWDTVFSTNKEFRKYKLKCQQQSQKQE